MNWVLALIALAFWALWGWEALKNRALQDEVRRLRVLLSRRTGWSRL